LLDIRPVNLVTRLTHADMLPVLFEFKHIRVSTETEHSQINASNVLNRRGDVKRQKKEL